MTLLGFQMGSDPNKAGQPATAVDMSLDEMIASRRKEQEKASKRGSVDKSTANKDRSIATSRAKRDAKMNARRGLSQSAKPTKMQIEIEVKKQEAKTKQNEARPRPTDAKLTGAAKAERRRKKREAAKAAKAAGLPAPKAPPKKAVKAAVNAMQESGFKVPEGMKMVISFEPKQGGNPKPAPGNQKPPPNKDGANPKKKNNNNRRRNKGGADKMAE